MVVVLFAMAIGLTLAVSALGVSKTGMLLLVPVVGAAVVGVVGVSHRDAASLLSLVSGLLFLVPENYVLVGPLKSAGNPALLVGMFALVAWLVARARGELNPVRNHPVRWVVFAFALVSLVAFAAGASRVVVDDEAAGALRALFPILAFVGMALLAVDGLVDTTRLEALLFRLVALAGVAAAIGILEFGLAGFSYRDLAHLPGLTVTTEIIDDTRSGFARVDGAAAHPIEYVVALAVLAPLALHYALNGKTRMQRRIAAASLVAILVVNPMTVSRSGLLALAVGLGFYVAHLSTRARVNGFVLAVVGLVLFRTAIPGLLGTLKSLVFVGDDDPSIAGRTEDYARIPGLMDGHWFFGRGLGTFQPLTYFYLDNQYLGALLEGGLLELAVLIAIFVTGVCLARGARKRATTKADRALGQALAGCIAALGAAAATFDELSFHQTGFLVFLLVGCAGAYWTAMRTAEFRRRAAGDGVGQVLTSGSPTHPIDAANPSVRVPASMHP